jgi:hypothetical protein
MGQRVLTVAFLGATTADHWINRLTSQMSAHPFCHVELFFESLDQCFSIVWGETAGFRSKNLSNPMYKLVSLSVSVKEYESCLEFCRSAGTHALIFDDSAMWRSWFPPALSCTYCDSSSLYRRRTFCSKIVTEALQFASICEVDRIIPAATTPSILYQALSSSSRVICSSVPYKRKALLNFSVLG